MRFHVTETASSASTPLLASAKGLQMEHGGRLSYDGIEAKRGGIPAVVGLPTATEILKDGQCVRMNVETGTIQMV